MAGAADLPAGHPPVDQTKAATPTHSGEVLEVIPVSSYVYLRVKGAQGEEWLAAPAAEIKTGARIRWNDGVLMHDFSSPTLKRSFAAIRFVEVVEPEPTPTK